MSKKHFIKCTTLLCLFFIISSVVVAQDEEYVISKPEKKKNRAILFSQLENPDYTNYFLTSSAFTLRSRDMRGSGTDIAFIKGSYGLTNNTTITINTSLFGMLIGSVKHRIELDDELNLGFVGSFGSIASISEDSLILFGGGQSMITLGDHQDNVTFGAGYYYVKSTFKLTSDNDELSIINIYAGLQKQIGRRVYLIADAIYFPEYHIITGGAGLKFIIKDNMSLLLGVMPLSQEFLYLNNRKIRQTLVIPLVSFRMLLDRH